MSGTSPAAGPRSRRLLCHVHSHYSLLEGVDSPEALAQRAAACGYEALALTDSNNLYGAVAFVEAARKHGVRPILGCRLSAIGCRPPAAGRQADSRQPMADSRHCTVLIAEPAGYTSLCRIISRLNLGGGGSQALGANQYSVLSTQYSVPSTLAKLLLENAEGLHVLVDQVDLALQLHGTFGERLWLEIVRPRMSNSEHHLLELGQRLGIKPVASTAVHFAMPAGYATHRLLTAIRLGILLDQLPKELPITPAHHLVDPETLQQRFRDLPEAVVNTQLLAAQCRSDVLPHGVTLPPAKVPRSLSASEYLSRLCQRGLEDLTSPDRKGGVEPRKPPSLTVGASTGDAYRERLAEELHLVNLRDLAGYFLVVRDIARYARRRGFSMALRGSAGNSLICYLLGITNVDPLRFKLPLERFLHAGRPDLPDIDLDFDWKVRDQVIAWAFERYGHAHTAMISSHLFLQPASAFREAGKVHGLSNEQISRLLEVWQRGGYSKYEGASAEGWEKPDTASGVASAPREEPPVVARSPDRATGSTEGLHLHHSGDLRSANGGTVGRPCHNTGGLVTPSPPPGFPLEPELWPRLLTDARRLIGRPHHLSIHPGGIVITPRPIEDYVPLQRAAKGIVITQLDKDPIEHIGLVKIDLLGNRALATVDECRARLCSSPALVGAYSGRCATSVRGSDAHLLDLLRAGDTLGLNQLESPAMRHLLVQMQPRGLIDVIQALALIRPGAASIGAKERFVRRRRGIEPTVYDHPRLEPLLGDTCGLMLYEDDALGVVQALTGFSAPEADHFRKRVTKTRDPQETIELSKAFIRACERNGVSRDAASGIWVQLAKFNEYSFCKSHSVSYGLIAWEAVKLKAEHPLEFWCAALNNNQGMYPRRVYIEAVKRAGIEVRLPCVNRSEREFAVEPLPSPPLRRGAGGEGVESQVVARSPDRATDSTEGLRLQAGDLRSASSGTVGRPCHNAGRPCHNAPASFSTPSPQPLSPEAGERGFLRTGLAIIHGLDEAAREAILEDRVRRGPFTDFTNFCQRVAIGAETLALLIQVGAFDFTGRPRPELLLEAEVTATGYRQSAIGQNHSSSAGSQQMLIDEPMADGRQPTAVWSPSDFSQPRRWKEEWERLGFLVGPLLMSLFRPYLPEGLPTSRDLPKLVGRRVCVTGLVATARHAVTKHGQTMQFMTLEDEWGFIDVTFFPGTFPEATYLGMGPYLVWGTVEEQYDVVTVTATRFQKQQIAPWS